MSGRILLVAPFPPPVGGDTVSTTRLAGSRLWKEAGFRIESVDTSAGEGVKPAEVKRTWKDPLRAASILWRVTQRIRRADVMLLWANSSFLVSLGIPLMNLAKMHGKPFIVKPFGTMLADRIAALDPARRKSVVSLLNSAVRVLPQTQDHAAELVVKAGLDPEKVEVFPNFLPDGAFAEKSRRGKFTGRCVFIGQIKEEKGVFDIIDALRGRPGMTCDFYGQILDRDRAMFFKALETSESCRYRGTLASDEIIGAIGRYDALLLPTRHPGEGQPAVILEAFAAGVPVVVTEWKSIPGLVGDGSRGMLVPVSSPGAILSALERLRDDEGLRGSIVENAREYVKAFSESTLIGRVLIGLVRGTAGDG